MVNISRFSVSSFVTFKRLPKFASKSIYSPALSKMDFLECPKKPLTHSHPVGTITLDISGAQISRQSKTYPLLYKYKPPRGDLIFTDQPNLVIESGTRPTLDNFCHHQITYCRMNFQIPLPSSFDRKMWHINIANIPLIRRAMINCAWIDYFNKNPDPNWQVETFTEILLNITSNFIPNKTIKVKHSDPPWISKTIKTMKK